MSRKLEILKKSTGQVIHQYAFALDDSATEQDYLNKTWFIAVSDGTVSESHKEDYEIVFLKSA